ncbi:MAG: nitrogen regulation protein NR(II) [Treponema lecithinolyticum]|uniref:two-component system sensor histidine kinase NtrB n=1 Tax=Treponema lecithinolyticum TaxID=53418 RepID=UPI0036180981
MRGFVKRVTNKVSKLTPDQIQRLLNSINDENEALDAVLESLSTGLLICNSRWQPILVNKAAIRYIPLCTQCPACDFVWECIEDEDIAEFLKVNSASQKKYISKEFTLATPAGSVRFVNISILPLVRSKKLSGYIVQIDDITEKRNQETLMRRMESLASLTNLAASVAHEIKNPLGAISIHIQLIQKALKKARSAGGRLPDEKHAEKYLDTVNEEIERLNKIIVDFLFAVRPISAQLHEADPLAEINSFIAFVKAELEQKHIKLETELMQKSVHVMIDTKLFRQVLINLVQNSIAAMPNGGFLWINAAVKNDRFLLRIADSGLGMDEKTVNRIFEPYFTTKPQGTGLGMTMVYKIIKEFAGDIDVKSFPGEGTLITLSLPVAQKERRLLEYDNQEKV